MTERTWTWTRPFHGVTHLDRGEGTGLRPQFTVSDYGRFAEALYLPGGSGFSGPTKTFWGDDAIAKAKAWLETLARNHE